MLPGFGDHSTGAVQPMERKTIDGREVLLEFHQVGDYVKVSAIDTLTNTEASIVGARKATQEELTRVALRKLEFVLRKNEKARSGGKPGSGIEI